MRKTAGGDDGKQAKPPPAGSIVSCRVTLPDGSASDVDIAVGYVHHTLSTTLDIVLCFSCFSFRVVLPRETSGSF